MRPGAPAARVCAAADLGRKGGEQGDGTNCGGEGREAEDAGRLEGDRNDGRDWGEMYEDSGRDGGDGMHQRVSNGRRGIFWVP